MEDVDLAWPRYEHPYLNNGGKAGWSLNQIPTNFYPVKPDEPHQWHEIQGGYDMHDVTWPRMEEAPLYNGGLAGWSL